MRMAPTTVVGIWVFLAGGGGVSVALSRVARAGFGSGEGGGVYGVYMDGGRLTVSAGAWSAVSAFTEPHTAAKSRAAAVRSALSTRSNRLRQRGHQDGSPARRQPQLGHASIPEYVGMREANLNLKGVCGEADSLKVNIVLIPALFLLIGLVVYKKVIEPKKAGDSKGTKAKAAKAKAAKAKPGKAKPGKAKRKAETKVAKLDSTLVPTAEK